jgi:acyl carrier protein
MTKTEFYEIIAQALEIEPAKIDDNLTMGAVDQWDSLGHLTIMTSLDDALDGRLEEVKDFSQKTSVGSMLQALQELGLVKG